MKKMLGLSVIMAAALLAGCASIVSKSQYPVSISSTPSGAAFTIKDRTDRVIHQAVTPCTVMLPASANFFTAANYTLQFEKAGYQTSTERVYADLDPWYIGNFFPFLWPGFFIDAATGAMWKMDLPVHSNLQPASGK